MAYEILKQHVKRDLMRLGPTPLAKEWEAIKDTTDIHQIAEFKLKLVEAKHGHGNH